MPSYPEIGLFIAGEWRHDPGRMTSPVVNPASGEEIGSVPHASAADLDELLAAAAGAFASWRATSPVARRDILRAAAQILRERAAQTAAVMTQEQGKPVAEARGEIERAADIIAWNADAAVALFSKGAARGCDDASNSAVLLEPLGVAAALTPWNVPVQSPARKVSMALAAGCPCILKASEETPASAVALVKAFADAGLPKGVLGLAFGDPAFISRHLIESPVVRVISFTGSVPIGKQLAELAGRMMKPVIMELGGHNPALIFDDVDPVVVAKAAVTAKFRNAGQVCTSPTRFYVQDRIHDRFVRAFVEAAKALKVGDGSAPDTQVGPVANARRLSAMTAIVEDAVAHGARVLAGGVRRGDRGYFFEPTVLADIADDSRFMREEPFGPIASVARFGSLEDGLKMANTVPLGLAGYVFASARETVASASTGLECGVVGVNRWAISLPHTPFGGVKDSGYGREGGDEGLRSFLTTRAIIA